TEDAPYGRKKDGTPYEFGEYLDNMTRAFRDIYGTKVDLRKDAEYFQSDAYKNAPWPNDVPAHRDDEDHDDYPGATPRRGAASPDHASSVDAAPEQPPLPVPPRAQPLAPDPQQPPPPPPRRVQTFDSNPGALTIPKRRSHWDWILP
ncbi:MAG TPA: hypothetical protein VMV94_09460, partial [Phycisphaerae bacterium]|nr:hypothetical protein [Phycisphaerae bacterium]